MKPMLTQLWPQFTADAAFMDSYGSAIVERVVADRQNKIITVVYRTANPVPAETSGRLIASLEPQFPGFALKVQGLFAYTCLTSCAVLELAEELKDAGLPINGFLSGAQVDISGEHITVRVQNGVLLLTQMEFAVKLEELIAARTGVRPQVALVCNTAISAEAVEEHILKKAPPARQFKAKSEGPAVKVQGLDLEDAPAKLVYTIQEGAEGDQVLELSKLADALADTVQYPGNAAQFDIEIHNESGNSYRYKPGSFTLASADTSGMEQSELLPVLGYDGQWIPFRFTSSMVSNQMLKDLFNTSSVNISLEQIVTLYDTLAEEGYDSLTNYFVAWYNKKNSTDYASFDAIYGGRPPPSLMDIQKGNAMKFSCTAEQLLLS